MSHELNKIQLTKTFPERFLSGMHEMIHNFTTTHFVDDLGVTMAMLCK